MRQRSLKKALLKSLILPLAGYIVMIGGFVYYTTVREIDHVYDANLVTAANVLYAITQRELDEGDIEGLHDLDISDKELTPEDREMYDQQSDWRGFRIWYGGKQVMSSDSSQWRGLPPFPEGFNTITYQGEAWRIYTLLVPENHVSVELGEQQTARNYLVARIVGNLIWPFLLSLPLTVWMFSRALEFGLNGLHKVTRQINTRSPELMTPLPITHIPADLIPLVDAINGLLGKISESLHHEQQLTDNAAHELRTPLAALKLQAQLAQRAQQRDEREDALKVLLSGVDRVSHVVDQLLALARIRNQSYPFIAIDMVQSAKQTIASLQPLLDQRQLSVMFEDSPVVLARANDQMLSRLLFNIIDNAMKYAPAGSSIRIAAGTEHGCAMLVITDEGPGIPEAERDLVFKRFYRINDHGVAGSGLGLAIAKECAERMAGIITLQDPDNGRGLQVKILLPSA
ncbi:MAG: sensor histidine kinase N-terminal domain-containing protein [Pseudomonadota bacterium]|nr:sensor histidine kinase N-terminal domain-containing protein [Pseudomonadota bacterium]MDE3037527.1 sensor histidine kinase N-terminal domain-containing protein [Pseudomonadota bacterium]